tara:strand:+ start:232 stop:666 length:435 start_codon:yes stop_codon:yes gene_type:complete
MSACYRTSNNKYFNAPPLMSDGRHFTDYRSSCVANAMIHVNNKLTNSYDYRTFLIRNAKNIINQDRQVNYIMNGCTECNNPEQPGTMLREKQVEQCTKSTCSVKPNFKGGLGQGRMYSPSTYECANVDPQFKHHKKNNQCGFKN